MYRGDPAALSPEQEHDEARQSDPDYYRCPHCGAAEPDVEENAYTGFGGTTCYAATWSCCGVTDANDGADVAATR